MALNIQIPVPTAEQAYLLFLQNINRIDWYESNARPYFLKSLRQMENPIINQMIDERKSLKDNEKLYIEKFHQPFAKNLYHPECYQKIADDILSYKDTFDKIHERFQQLHDSWGFKIWPEYVVDLNMYVSNGSYNSNTGHIILGIKNGKIKADLNMIKLIMHEMVHLGIEKSIVRDEQGNILLKQNEKERVVDNLCRYVGKGIFPDDALQFQRITEPFAYMDEFVSGQPRKNLAKEIQSFLKKKGSIKTLTSLNNMLKRKQNDS